MKFLTPSFILLLGFVLGGIIFKSIAPIRCGTIMPGDSMFVLTGDVRRIPFGIRIAQENPDAKLYIIGVSNRITPEIAKQATIESKSKSTYQNALAIKKIAKDTNPKRIVLITTEDHMNRAMYLVRGELPEYDIVACPVNLHGMRAAKRLERWTIEYIKYIVTMIGIKEG